MQPYTFDNLAQLHVWTYEDSGSPIECFFGINLVLIHVTTEF